MRRIRWAVVPLVILSLFPPLALAARPGMPGSSAPQTGPAVAVDDEKGVFAELCRYSHTALDDPIVKPGQPGASHSHDFFGNVTTNANSTYESLRVGGTTCRTQQDAAGYWVPTLSRNGVAVTPFSVKIYYRDVDNTNPAAVQPFPPGFRMVAGDAMATAPQPRGIAFWGCRGIEGLGSLTPPTCAAGAPLDLHVRFPECWDGANPDSADHKSHMAYGSRVGCPADHPVLLPKLALIVHYDISGDPGVLSLASGGVYSGHADFFNAWDQSFLAQRVQSCLADQVRSGALQARGLRHLLGF